jgi:DNA-binding HxlR family transcriptional regulator
MKKLTNETKADEICTDGALVKEFQWAMRVLNGKWKSEIIWQLVQRKQRFGELRSSISGITQHMLTTTLRDLEADGLVKRTVYPEVPPRVEYEITASARALRPVFDELLRWSQEHGPHARAKAEVL